MAPHRRSLFLINRPFQLRFALYVCSWLFALSVVYPLIIYSLFDFFTRYLARDPNGPLVSNVVSMRQEVILLLVFFQIVFLVITFMISIFVSHRIAGPLYKLKNFFRQNTDGKLSPELRFRKGDHFTDIAEEYNEMLGNLRTEFKRIKDEVANAANDLDGASAGSQPDSNQLKKIVANLHRVSENIPQ